MLAQVTSATLIGVEGHRISVEVHVSPGLPHFTIVGLPDASCREARDRVRAALLSSGLSWPKGRITVNLAPTGLRKGGAALDLPIAVALLIASEQVPGPGAERLGYIGELGLDGSLRRVFGTLALVHAMGELPVVVPERCWQEAALLGRRKVRGCGNLAELVAVLRGSAGWPAPPSVALPPSEWTGPDLADVRGQDLGRRAVEISAAGGHHLLMVGPPGAGKTMLAERLAGLLPPLGPDEALEVTRIHSAAGLPPPPGALVQRPPYRAPHHGASAVSLIGGGGHQMRPGELSCAHRGVLFLDELGEFPASVLDSLRQPLEEGRVLVCRARASVCFPAQVLLVAAMNPCPCGGDGGPGSCRCRGAAIERYRARVSGPLLDRFDLRIIVQRPDVGSLLRSGASGIPESTACVAERVARCRAAATERGFAANALIPAHLLDSVAPMRPAASRLLEKFMRQGRVSARGLARVRRVALTVADLRGGAGPVEEDDVAEALAMRDEVFTPTVAA